MVPAELALVSRLPVIKEALCGQAEVSRVHELMSLIQSSNQFLIADDAESCHAIAHGHLLQSVIDKLPLAIALYDGEGELVFANRGAESLLGRARTSHGFLERDRRRAQVQERLKTMDQSDEEYDLIIGSTRGHYRTTYSILGMHGRNMVVTSSYDLSAEVSAREELLHRTLHDELTGLPTRYATEQHIHALTNSLPDAFAIAFLDIDNFKTINDVQGHAIGDKILIEVSRRIEMGLRPSDLLCRVSGDEFLLLLNPINEKAETGEYIRYLAKRLQEPYLIEGVELFASASIGVAFYPEHGKDFATLCRSADTAMYSAKRTRKGILHIFSEDMEAKQIGRLASERALRLAIIEDRFICMYQPKVDIVTGKTVGVEALVRLEDENGEIQSPSTFIDLASELGLMNEITIAVLRHIIHSIDDINLQFGPTISISMNISAAQAGDIEFMSQFTSELGNLSFADRFIIEVTEDAFVAAGALQKVVLPMIKQVGAKLSIDDFGTGYSSLSSLADIVADEVKIDRSFISNIDQRPRNQGILAAIQTLCETLDLSMIVEGVETEQELAYLRAHTNITVAQGFYFSKPQLLASTSAAATRNQFARERDNREIKAARAC